MSQSAVRIVWRTCQFSTRANTHLKKCIIFFYNHIIYRFHTFYFLTLATPSSQPLMTSPFPILNLNGLLRSRDESNFLPSVKVPITQNVEFPFFNLLKYNRLLLVVEFEIWVGGATHLQNYSYFFHINHFSINSWPYFIHQVIVLICILYYCIKLRH